MGRTSPDRRPRRADAYSLRRRDGPRAQRHSRRARPPIAFAGQLFYALSSFVANAMSCREPRRRAQPTKVHGKLAGTKAGQPFGLPCHHLELPRNRIRCGITVPVISRTSASLRERRCVVASHHGLDGRRKLSPLARLAAKASRVRWLISRRSYCEPEMMILAAISPAGVLVSRSRSAKWSAQPSRAARSIRPAPSTTERLNLSILATSNPAALPASTASRAASAAGRPFKDFALMPSSQYSPTITRPWRSA